MACAGSTLFTCIVVRISICICSRFWNLLPANPFILQCPEVILASTSPPGPYFPLLWSYLWSPTHAFATFPEVLFCPTVSRETPHEKKCFLSSSAQMIFTFYPPLIPGGPFFAQVCQKLPLQLRSMEGCSLVDYRVGYLISCQVTGETYRDPKPPLRVDAGCVLWSRVTKQLYVPW